jgi:hypothetical protein
MSIAGYNMKMAIATSKNFLTHYLYSKFSATIKPSPIPPLDGSEK